MKTPGSSPFHLHRPALANLSAAAIAGWLLFASAAAVESPQISADVQEDFRAARAYLRGDGVPKDPAKAYELMEKAAAGGHPDAIGGLGYFHAAGVVVPQDPSAAVEWFRKGAEKGSPTAKLNLGLALARGRGVDQDHAAGLEMIDSAAASGLPDALYAQGETYYWGQFGRGVNYVKARQLFEESAAKGYAGAQNNLAVILRDGLEVPKDEAKALDLFRHAALQGNARAQSNLGHLMGVNSADRTRRVEALKWLILASEGKEITAEKTMEEVSATLPADEIAEAKEAAEAFQPAKAS